VNDRKRFPEVASLKGKLIIFDLGYWDFNLFHEIDVVSGFFLSRVKSNAVITVSDVVKGSGKQFVGEKLSSESLKKKRKKIIAFIGKLGAGKDPKSYRIIGIWNPRKKKYHWYVTNLNVSSSVIYTLYRIRWQIELIFKGCQRSLNADKKMTTLLKRSYFLLLFRALLFTLYLVKVKSG